MVATLQRTDQIVVAPAVITQAQKALTALHRGKAPSPIPADRLGSDLSRVLTQVLENLAAGHAVTVTTIPKVLTSTAAADMIGISRTTLMRHARAGEIPSHKVGTHTRFRREDVLKFREAQMRQRREALQELLELEDELNLT